MSDGATRISRRGGANKIFDDVPHCVEWKTSLETAKVEWAYFTSFADAEHYKQNKVDQNLFVWVAEIGDCKCPRGEMVRRWLYYWWSPNTTWEGDSERGKGYISDSAEEMTDYIPLDKTGWTAKEETTTAPPQG